jgi:hypothetical protein
VLEDLVNPELKVWPCAVRTVVESLEPGDQKLLQGYLADADTWPARHLSRALAPKGIVLSDKVIGRHRLKECSCSKILK